MERNTSQGIARRPSSRKRASLASIKRKKRSMGPHAECFKIVSPPFATSSRKSMSQQQTERQTHHHDDHPRCERDLKRQKTKSRDIHMTHTPLSVPVSPSDNSTTCDSSLFRSLREAPFSHQETASFEAVEAVRRRSRRLSTPISLQRSGSVDLSLCRVGHRAGSDARHISAYLNVEGGSDVDDDRNAAAASSDKGEDSSCFRICIHADPSTSMSTTKD
jgi:hypothetical protein